MKGRFFVKNVRKQEGHEGVAGYDAIRSKVAQDPMKFKNGDVRLDDAIKHNGGHIILSGTNILFDKSW